MSILAVESTQPLCRRVMGHVPQGGYSWGVKINTHQHLVPRFRMSGCLPPFSHMLSWCVLGQLHLHRVLKLTSAYKFLIFFLRHSLYDSVEPMAIFKVGVTLLPLCFFSPANRGGIDQPQVCCESLQVQKPFQIFMVLYVHVK